jgi:hypothetical protein
MRERRLATMTSEPTSRPLAAALQATVYENCSTSHPNPSGPIADPTNAPVCVMPVAAAGASEF